MTLRPLGIGLALGMAIVAWTPTPATAQTAPRPRYRNAALPIETRVNDLLGRMTREEKFWQLYMVPGDLDDPRDDYSHGIFGLQVRIADTTPGIARRHATKINAIQRYFVEQTRLGIPIIAFEEALHGLMAPGATVFPQAIGLAATWDTAMMSAVAGAIARETRARGIRQALSPVLNLASDVRWGRTEETYGEDPWLVARMGVAFVTPLERLGVIATPKHFVANVGDGGRDSYPIEWSARMLAEAHLPPFGAAIREAGARSIMTAYNSVHGIPATQSRWLLTKVLRDDLGFGGFVISDQAATGGTTVLHHTEATTPDAAVTAWRAGLDVVFQGQLAEAAPYRAAVRSGRLADSVLDRAVSRVLAAKFALGLFERPYVDPDSAEHWNGHARHRTLAREAAEASVVLLRNERGALPLGDDVRRIVVIGDDAVEARLGGYSGAGSRRISLLEGIRQRAGAGVTVRHAAGPGRLTASLATIPAGALIPDSGTSAGLVAEYFDNPALRGEPVRRRVDPGVDFRWTLSSPDPALSTEWYSVRWTGAFEAVAGLSRIGVEGSDGFRLFLDDSLVIDRWRKGSAGLRSVPVALAPGSRHRIRLEFHETTGNGRIRLGWDVGVERDGNARIARAVALARESDVAIVAAGIEEGEFRDRASLALPGQQEDLIRAVAAVGRPTIVVLFGGSAVTMSRWLDSVAAVVQAWYPGEEGGPAVARVLFGDVNPGGRLPITFPLAEGQLPLVYNHRPTGRGDDYVDLPGDPLFPFGFGLSYTTFEYGDLTVTPAVIRPDGGALVHFTVRNTGDRVGDEVVQLYLRDELASTVRPVRQLAGFSRVRLAPGERREVTFRVGRRQLEMLDARDRWVVEPGRFQVMVGSSSRDIRLRGAVTVR